MVATLSIIPPRMEWTCWLLVNRNKVNASKIIIKKCYSLYYFKDLLVSNIIYSVTG
jgi:hypothetical protein